MSQVLAGSRGRVDFEESEHKYTCAGRTYISGTTLIGKLKPNQCWWGIAYRYAKKNGGKAAFWLQEWKKESIKGTTKGTIIHNGREKKILESKGMLVDGEKLLIKDQRTLLNMSEIPRGVYAEMRLWCHYAEIAGTADLVIVHGDGSVSIIDWKTNKQIRKGYNYIDKYSGKPVINKYMKAPVDHMVDCEYSHYQLQLSLYAFMLEIMGFKIRKLAIVHITDNNKVYYCDYLRKEIQQIVAWYVC